MDFDTEHRAMMAQARRAIAGAGLRGFSSLHIREARIYLELHRPVVAMRCVGVSPMFPI